MTHLSHDDVEQWLRRINHTHQDGSCESYSAECRRCVDFVQDLHTLIVKRYGDFPYAKPGTESMRD